MKYSAQHQVFPDTFHAISRKVDYFLGQCTALLNVILYNNLKRNLLLHNMHAESPLTVCYSPCRRVPRMSV